MFTHTSPSIQIGQSRLSFSPPNLIDVTFGPSVSANEIREIASTLQRISTEHGVCDLVADMSALSGLSMATRERTMDVRLDGVLRGVAFVRARFAVRVTVDMVFKAFHFLHARSEPFFPYAFFDQREEALRWIASLPPSP